MKTKELARKIQDEFDRGASLRSLYEKYAGEVKEKKLAFIIATAKDRKLLERHRTARISLIVVMVLMVGVTALAGYAVALDYEFSNPIYWTAVAIIPLIFLIGFLKSSFWAFTAYIGLSISQLPKAFQDFGEDVLGNSIALTISIGIIALVWWVKIKIFPYMGFLKPKQDPQGKYQFQKDL